MSDVEDLLSRVPLFAKLSKKDLNRLALSMKERTFDAGSVVTDLDHTGVGFFVIVNGSATVTAGGEDRDALKAGDYFGEISLLDGGPRTATIVAETDLHCYGMTAWEFRPFVLAHPDVAWTLLTTLAQRVRTELGRTANS
jgi:CRP/FNR family transcriptional regulator, cyclic AMP receptor protein